MEMCLNCDHESEQHIEFGPCVVSKCPCLTFVAQAFDECEQCGGRVANGACRDCGHVQDADARVSALGI